MAKHPPPLPDFESALGEIDRLVTSLESGKGSLEESMQAYERGARLLAHCRATLANAEQRLRVLDLEPAADSGESPEREE